MNGFWLSDGVQGKRHMDGENMMVSARDVACDVASGGGSGSGRWSRRAMMAAGASLGSSPLAMLAGCAGSGGGGAGPDAVAKLGQPVTLRYLVPAGTKAEQDITVYKQYQAENPKITVTVEQIPSTINQTDRMFALAAGNDLPDVLALSDARVKPYALQGVAADLDKLAAKDKASQDLLKDVYPNMLGLGRFKSKPGLYMLPWALDVLVTYYNKTMFRQAGVDLPKPNWTIDDFITTAKRLTKDTGDESKRQFGVTVGWTAWSEYVPWMLGYGGDMLTPDGKKSGLDMPGTIEGIDAMASLVTKHNVAAPIGYDFGGDGFNLGRVGMRFSIRNAVVAIRNAVKDNFEWDVELRPAFPKKRVVGMGTQGVTVSTQTKQPDVAWHAAKYTITPAGQKIYASQYASVPVLQSLRNDPVWRNLPAPPANVDAFIKAADFGTLPPDFPETCGTVYIGDLNVLMTQTINDIVNGKVAAGTALRDAAAKVNACLARA
ncbi:MAG TPA: extracellular solute-binding protein [Chloroflexota bacterium]|nr:extracellular solute-binding protein [Chloroflexota bacterium]